MTNDDTRQALTTIRAAINVLLDKENQDRLQVASMADQMLADLLAGQIETENYYIGLYCDVIDEPGDIDAIVAEIGLQIIAWEEDTDRPAPPPAPGDFPGVDMGLLAYDIGEAIDHGEYHGLDNIGYSDIEPNLPAFLAACQATALASED
jgi:hypothetical protein